MTNCSPFVSLGKDADIDEGVLLGYITAREVSSEQLTIGTGARLRSGTVIYAGSTVGRNFQSGHNVIIREENTVGDDVCVWSNTIVDYGCRIGDRVKIHSDVYVAQFTTIEDDVFLAPGVVVANDIHPGCPFSVQCMRGPTIRQGAQIGANVTLLPRITIGEHALIGAGSVVTRDIPARAVAYGNPARVCGSVSDLVCVTGITDVPYPGL